MTKIEGEIHFTEFKAQTHQDWVDKIIKDLKGKDFDDTLVKTNREGISYPPNFHPEKYSTAPQKIGQSPYRRGWKKDNFWDTRVPVFGSNSKDLNKEILFALQNGASSVYIPKHDYHFSQLFEDVQLDVIAVDFESLTKDEAIAFQEYCKTCQYDPINNKGWVNEDATSMDPEALLTQVETWRHYSNFRPISISAIKETHEGLNLSHQLGLALAKAHTVIQNIDDKADIDTLSSAIVFQMSAASDLFLEIAKIRAFKVLYAHFITQFEPEHECSKIAMIHSTTCTWNLSQKDTYTNLLRNTTAAAGAVLGGIDFLTVSPFDMNQPDSSFVQRMSRNTSLILRDEAFFSRVADPAGGAYFIEFLTNALIDKGWTFFQEIEAKGGYHKAQEFIKTTVTEDQSVLLQQYKDGDATLVGINKFQPETPTGTIEQDTIASKLEQ